MKMSTTFDFGYGPEPAKQHPNGGGWVANTASVAPNARVCDNARVYGNARVCDNAVVYGNARVYGKARVYGNARVCDNARVYGNARVCDNAVVYGNARVYGKARVCDNARVYGNAVVYGIARVHSDAVVYGDARVNAIGDCWAISCLEYPITYTRSDDSVIVGCQRKTVADWIRAGRGDDGEHPDHVIQLLRVIFADRLGGGA